MAFEREKAEALSKMDKSKKGGVDEPILDILKAINGLEDYYTTSSCSGRIMILEMGEKRFDCRWLWVSHDRMSLEELMKHKTEEAWIIQTGLILHIACRTMEKAQDLVNYLRQAGFKKTGIISYKKNIVEIESTEKMAAPLKGITEEYARVLADNANRLMDKTAHNREKLLNYINLIKQ